MPVEQPLDKPLTMLQIDSIIPYWRNPRHATLADVAKLMRSIEEYGYQNPIIVDQDHVIICGHTRYLALRRLGWTEVEVIVSDMDSKAAKEYRVIDNRVGEFTAWDRTALLEELKAFTSEGVLGVFFPEVDLTFTGAEVDLSELITPYDAPEPPRPAAKPSPTVVCPHCFQEFDIASAKVIEILAPDDEEDEEP